MLEFMRNCSALFKVEKWCCFPQIGCWHLEAHKSKIHANSIAGYHKLIFSIHYRLLKAIESPMANGNTINLALLNNFEHCSRSSYLHCKAYASIKCWSAWMFSKDNLCPTTMVCMTFYIEGASCKWDFFLFSKSIC